MNKATTSKVAFWISENQCRFVFQFSFKTAQSDHSYRAVLTR